MGKLSQPSYHSAAVQYILAGAARLQIGVVRKVAGHAKLIYSTYLTV